MKLYSNIKLIALVMLGSLMNSCDDPATKVTFLGSGTAPVLNVSSTKNDTLTALQAAYSSLQFQWTNPSYKFSNGVNTQDVNYALQIDTTGSNFTNPNMVSVAFTGDVSTNFTVKSLDDALAGLQLKDGVPHAFEFRIMATLGSGTDPVYSNVIKINITTYLDTIYPVPDNLYIVGTSTQSGWSNDNTHPDATQTFTKVNPYLFTLKLTLNGGGEFLLLPVAGSWNHKYSFPTADGNNTSGDVFVPDASGNFKGPATTGSYTITVNFKTGKFTIQ